MITANGALTINHSMLPTAQEIASYTEVLKYSHDVAFLQRFVGWHLFCYSREQIGHPDYNLINDATHVGTAYSLRTFAGWKKKLGSASHAIALDEGPDFDPLQEEHVKMGWKPMLNAYRNRIRGEIHFVTPDTIVTLDKLLENGVAFERRRVSLILPYRFLYEGSDGKKHVSVRNTAIIVAYMYVGKDDYWTPQLDRGYMFSPIKLFQPNDPEYFRYYHFDKLSYDE